MSGTHTSNNRKKKKSRVKSELLRNALEMKFIWKWSILMDLRLGNQKKALQFHSSQTHKTTTKSTYDKPFSTTYPWFFCKRLFSQKQKKKKKEKRKTRTNQNENFSERLLNLEHWTGTMILWEEEAIEIETLRRHFHCLVE